MNAVEIIKGLRSVYGGKMGTPGYIRGSYFLSTVSSETCFYPVVALRGLTEETFNL